MAGKKKAALKKKAPAKSKALAKPQDILLEIGTEEIPARFIPTELDDIKVAIAKALSAARVGHGAIVSYATPRRLAVIVKAVEPRQADMVREAFGPPKKAAFDEQGNLTQAALGFARSQGVDPKTLVVKAKEKGEYIAAVIEERGKQTKVFLPELLKSVVLSLNFPKSMRWGDGTVRYARPIHWIAALYGSDTVKFEIEGIKSGNKSRGHRFLAPKEFTITKPESYPALLEKHRVIVDRGRRMETIRAQAAKLASEAGGKPVYDDELLSIVACILEYPVAVRAGFEKKYLDLPSELLSAVMVGHQKYFPVRSKGGPLANSFIIVSNTSPQNAANVRAGAERVIRARFDDAKFYFEEDRKVRLIDRLEALKKVTFQIKLGSLYDKAMRMKAVAEALSGMLCPEKKALVSRAAELAKNDLITGVVREFPELQGVMGMYYARLDGEDHEVSKALEEQYLPRFSGDRVPETDIGTVICLAERADNIASFFSINLKPTGSEDPFALRRQALGIISVLIEKGLPYSVREIMASALKDKQAADAEVMLFFEQRIENLLGQRGYAFDLVQAVLNISTSKPLSDIIARIDALKAFKEHGRYNEFLTGIKRVRNIIPQDKHGAAFDEALLREPEERALWDALGQVSRDVEAMVASRSYEKALARILDLTGPINGFFDKVLVMDKDEAVKANRLALLRRIWSLAESVADCSRLQER